MGELTFIERLRRFIEADPDLNPTSLSLRAGLDKTAIRQMLAKSNSPRIETAEKICAAIGTTLTDFMAPDISDRNPVEKRITVITSQLSAEQQLRVLGYAEGLLHNSISSQD